MPAKLAGFHYPPLLVEAAHEQLGRGLGQVTTVDSEQRRAHDLIGEIIRKTGLTASEIARRAGLSPSTLTRIYPFPSVGHTLSARTLAKIHSAFPLMDGSAAPSSVEPPRPERQGLQILTVSTISETGAQGETSDFELFKVLAADATPQLAQLAFSVDPRRFFVIYMPGTSMAPRIMAGEAIIADRVRPPAIQSDVVIVSSDEDGHDTIRVGILAERTQNSITVRSITGENACRIAMTSVSGIHPIVGIINQAACF